MNANKFTQKSIEAVSLAQNTAIEYQNQAVAPEHLLYALLKQENGLVSNLLSKMGADPSVMLERVEDEIEKITSTDPYLYKLLLADDEAVRAKKSELEEEIRTYKEYAAQLDELIAQFSIERNYS